MANDSPVGEVVVVLDSCFSGWMGNEPMANNMAVLREGLSILTASRGDQVSVGFQMKRAIPSGDGAALFYVGAGQNLARP